MFLQKIKFKTIKLKTFQVEEGEREEDSGRWEIDKRTKRGEKEREMGKRPYSVVPIRARKESKCAKVCWDELENLSYNV